jgi:two-component system, response regulator, stage 0 sporulation protein F
MHTHYQPAPAIVIADDDPHILALLSRLVRRWASEHDIITAPDGAAALAYLANRQVPLVITDYNMAGMNGLQLSARIKAQAPNTRTMLITGSPTPTLEKRARAEWVDYYLHKPFLFDQFEYNVRAALAPL